MNGIFESERLLRRREAAEALTEAGFKIAPATLAKLASVGGGPPFRRFGAVPVYTWPDLLAWARARLMPPRRPAPEDDGGLAEAGASTAARGL